MACSRVGVERHGHTLAGHGWQIRLSGQAFCGSQVAQSMGDPEIALSIPFKLGSSRFPAFLSSAYAEEPQSGAGRSATRIIWGSLHIARGALSINRLIDRSSK